MHADNAAGGLLRVKNRWWTSTRAQKALEGEVESANDAIV
jgi:hypothetical protein